MVVTGAECKYVVNAKGQDLDLEGNLGLIKPCLSQHIFFLAAGEVGRCNKDKGRRRVGGNWSV